MKHVFFINTNTLKRRTESCINGIYTVCSSNGLDYSIHDTNNIKELRKYIMMYKNYTDIVYYAVGGDGTLHSLVNNVDLDKAILQYLPYGTGNNSYNTFYNQKFDLKRDILNTSISKADLGSVNGEYFVSTVGLGLDASIAKNVEMFRHMYMNGELKYYFSIFYTLFKNYDDWSAKFDVDGITLDKNYSFISITNGQTIGGKTKITKNASAFDGKLNLVMVDKVRLLKLLQLFSMIKSGNHLLDKHVNEYFF